MDEEYMELQHKLEEFTRLVNIHDVAYDFSDDHDVYNAGKREYDKIIALAKQLPHENAVFIWNKMIDARFHPLNRANYYWSV